MVQAALFAVVFGLLVLAPGDAKAHCDTMSGPVVTAARQALDTGNINLVLIWVQPEDETALREEFTRARSARTARGAAREVADRRFFEALVRIHRAGEGAPYTGIRPADTDVGPAVSAADQSLAAGSVDAVRAVLTTAVQTGIERHFRAVSALKSYDPNDVATGRAYVAAYVQYTHFAEGLYDKATAVDPHHEHGGDGPAAGHEAHGTADPGAHAGHSSLSQHLPWILVGLLGLALIGETGWLVARRKRG